MARSRKENIFFNQARETLSWEERRERLNENFLATWSHVWGRSRAYRDFYREAGVKEGDVRSLDDLPGLPILRMADLVERQKKEPPFGGFETVDPKEIRRVYINPGLIFQPGDWDYRDTSWAEALCGAGFKEGDRVINTFNYHLWPYAFMLDDSIKMIGATVIPAGAGNTMMQVRIMGQLKINGFLGTPSFLMTLAERAEGMGLEVRQDLSLETAMVGAEMLSESLRTRLEDKMGISIRQCYGTVFLGCIGYECPYMEGLHVPDNTLVEVVDPHDGRPVRPGATGEIVATNFSPAYPFIRLATGDLSLLSREPCSCGRTGPMLKKVLGRIDQATKVRGTFIHPWQTDEVIAHYPEVFKYQVIVTRKEHKDIMTFKVELTEEFYKSNILCTRIERDIEEMLTTRGVVEIVPRGTIPDFYKKIEDRRSWD